MARNLLLRLALLALVVVASAQLGGKRPKPKAPVFKEDLKFIRCQVCESMAKQATAVAKAAKEAAGVKRVSEYDILDKIEKMCDPDQDDGDWITQLDVVKSEGVLKLKDMGMMGKCKSTCRTVARACEMIHEDVDLTELSAMLFKGEKRAGVLKWMCYESTDACSSKTPALPADRKRREAFQPMDDDEVKAMKTMRSMKAAGLSGTMYNRETMEEELAEMRDEYGDDEEFQKMMAATGLSDELARAGIGGGSGGPVGGDDDDDDFYSGSSRSGGGAGGGGGGVADVLQKATQTIKEGASRLVETVSGLASKVYGKVSGSGKAAKPAGGSEL